MPGAPADRAPVTRAAEAATALAGFLSALHHPAPGDAPTNPYRGGPLTGQADGFAEALTDATARDSAGSAPTSRPGP